MASRKNRFPFPMTKREKTAGTVYIFVHTFLIGYIVSYFSYYVLPLFGASAGDTTQLLISYGIGFAFVLVFMFSYLRESFSDMLDAPGTAFISLIIAFIGYFVLNSAISMGLGYLLENLTNPNSEAVGELVSQQTSAMTVVTVLFAPVLEEALFRGVVFGSIRTKNRVLAYIVSVVVFAVYHLWDYFVFAPFDWAYVLYLLQYLAPGIALAWVYERSRSIWPAVFLHMIINYIAVSFTVM